MKILIAGDVHGDIDNICLLLDIAISNECEHIYVCGDFGIFNKLKRYETFEADVIKMSEEKGVHVHFIKGNHEDHNYLEELCGDSNSVIDISDFLHYHPNQCVWTIDGLRFGAMGGAHSIDIFSNRRIENVDWFRNEMISQEDVHYSEEMGRIDVLLCHDQPITGNIDDYLEYPMDPLTIENRMRLQKICENVRPKLLIHGHYHRRMDFKGNYTKGERKVIEFPIISLHCNHYLSKQYIVFNTDKFCNGRLYANKNLF